MQGITMHGQQNIKFVAKGSACEIKERRGHPGKFYVGICTIFLNDTMRHVSVFQAKHFQEF
jgi:hypothetical protein